MCGIADAVSCSRMYHLYRSEYTRIYGEVSSNDNQAQGPGPRWRNDRALPDYSGSVALQWGLERWLEDDSDTEDSGHTPTPPPGPRVEPASPTGQPGPQTSPEQPTSPTTPSGQPGPPATPSGQPDPPTTPSGQPDPPNAPSGQPSSPTPDTVTPLIPSSQPGPPQPDTQSDLKVVEVNLQIRSNILNHHTSEYEGKDNLIIRRGQIFNMKVTVDQLFDRDNDIIRLQMAMGNDPKINKGTMFLISPVHEHDLSEATAVIDSVETEEHNTVISLAVNLPYDSVIGVFMMRVNVKKQGAKKFTRYVHEEPINVLFNPWCKDDDVYMENEADIKEYVMSEYGRQYVGNSKWPSSRPWHFGQFQRGILDAAMLLLDASKTPWAAYGNLVRVTRCLSAKVNSNDDNGVLTGNWSGKYDDGTSPSKWQGSVKILQQYLDSEPRTPVRYGQCWVFSGVLTTVCRALGIPCRSVTNFDSAHDSDGSMTIDSFFDHKGKAIRSLNDSVWNFHVWNEAWFKRMDVPGDGAYDGWQAFDSTPQELSDGDMRCGPAPVKAIKDGHVELSYDARFIFAEVNGDRVTWIKEKDGTLTPTKHVTNTVGSKISTKAVGKDEREDVTTHYKYPENTEEERTSVKRALKLSSRRDKLNKLYDMDKTKHLDMSFDAVLDKDATATFTFKAKNVSDGDEKATYTVEGLFTVIATYYTGAEANDIKEVKVSMTLEPDEEKEHIWTMTAQDWINQVDEDAQLGVYGVMDVKGTKQRGVWRHVMQLEKPFIECTLDKTEVKVNESVDVTMRFENPLSLELTKCTLHVEGAGVLQPTEIAVKDVASSGIVEEKIKLTPTAIGFRNIMATFHSRQLVNISGVTELNVTDNKPLH